MRSRKTNILQAIVVLTAVFYIVTGLFYYFSPLTVLRMFAENVSENWLELVRDNELVGPLYTVMRAFAGLVLVSGVTQVMPLFDPLKYRLLIYLNGILFPAMGCLVFYSHLAYLYLRMRRNAGLSEGPDSSSTDVLILVMAVIFTVTVILNFTGLMITRSDAKNGRE